MPRPKGSKNKPKITLNKNKNGSYTINVKMEKQIAEMPINRDSRMGYIKWGTNNKYPLYLLDLYYNSPTHKSCIDFIATSVLGDGVDYVKSSINELDDAPNYMSTWDEFIFSLALDEAIYGGYAFQIIKNKDGKTYSYFHQPFDTVRCSPRDEDGVITSYWICSDWTAVSQNPPIELKAFGFQDDEEIRSGEPYIFVSNEYTPGVDYYPIPSYTAALKSIQTEEELVRYDLKTVLNSFTASGILTLNRVDEEEEKQALIDNITAMFTGAENGGAIAINFKNNDEETPAVFTRFDKDADGVNLFEQLNDRVVSKIIAAHKISNKALIGYEADSAMLGGEGNVISVAYNLFNKTVANKLRNNIIRTINNALKMNGIETQIQLKPLTFNITDTNDTQSNTSTSDTVRGEETSERATSDNKGNIE